MPTTISVLDSGSVARTVTTLELYGTAPGTPSTSPITIQPSTVPLPISSGTPVFLSSQSGAITVASITSGTVSISTSQLSSLYTTAQAMSAGFQLVALPSDQPDIDVILKPTTSGGLTVSSVLLSTTTNATVVSTRAAQLYHIEGFNVSSIPVFVKLYNLSSTPTVGSSLVSAYYSIPNSSQGAGFIASYENGVAFGTGISYTVTSSMSSSDTTVVQTLNAISLSLYWK